MTPKTKHVGLFLMTGLVLALASIYALPMQQALACGGGCDGGGKKGGGSGGSLVNVQDNGNIKTGNVKVGNVGNNKIGNVKTGDIASGNYLKFLNNNNLLSKNNILSGHSLVEVERNNFLNGHSLVEVEDFANNLHSLAEVEKNPVNTNILNSYYKEICGC